MTKDFISQCINEEENRYSKYLENKKKFYNQNEAKILEKKKREEMEILEKKRTEEQRKIEEQRKEQQRKMEEQRKEEQRKIEEKNKQELEKNIKLKVEYYKKKLLESRSKKFKNCIKSKLMDHINNGYLDKDVSEDVAKCLNTSVDDFYIMNNYSNELDSNLAVIEKEINDELNNKAKGLFEFNLDIPGFKEHDNDKGCGTIELSGKKILMPCNSQINELSKCVEYEGYSCIRIEEYTEKKYLKRYRDNITYQLRVIPKNFPNVTLDSNFDDIKKE